MSTFREGLLYYWPLKMQQAERPPLPVRVLRIHTRKGDVWLMTSVLDAARLSRESARLFYRWRWRNEGLFRSYKRTLGKVKLLSRTVVQVHRELEGSLLAVQLLLAQGTLAVQRETRGSELLCSLRGVLRAVRAEMTRIIGRNLGPRQWQDYCRRLEAARLERRRRRSRKERRPWPRRKPHKEPKPPRIHVLTPELKARIQKELKDAQAA